MRVIPEDEFKKMIEIGYELRRIEFKAPFAWDNEELSLWLREKVIRGILGLANTKDGGDIIIGIEEKDDKAIELVELTEKQIKSFNYDLIKNIVDSYASPSVEFDIVEGKHSVKRFLTIRVREFDDIPIICRKNGQHKGKILEQGNIYCRSRSGSPATITVTEKELREILELAVDKNMQGLKKRGYIRENRDDVKNAFSKQIQDIV